METKPLSCLHEDKCVPHALGGCYSTFKWCFFFKFLLSKSIGLLNLRGGKSTLRQVMCSGNTDIIRFAAVYSLINGSYKLLLCYLRRQGWSDKAAAPLCGFVAGLISGLDHP